MYQKIEIGLMICQSLLFAATSIDDKDALTNVDMRVRTGAERLSRSWLSGRWNGIRRPYSAEDVCKLRGTVHPEYTLARLGAEKFERLLRDEAYIPTLGALTGVQALQMVQAGLKAIYMSGWQVAASANLSGQTYPGQSPSTATRSP